MALRSKWDVLQERLELARKAFRDIEYELQSLERTTLGAPCAGCAEVLATEADFARHFLVPDERFLNLGECPRSQ